jgi:hypothetical protein
MIGGLSSNQERRRAPRVHPGPLKVSMYARDGELIDISDSGAAIRASFPHSSGEFLAFVLRWNDESILLRGRVVRSATHRIMPARDSGIAKIEHHIGVEFVSLPPHSVDQLKRLTDTVH